MLPFLIEWLLCTVAFLIGGYGQPEPYAVGNLLTSAVAGVLVAIAIAFVPGLHVS
jgi:hypothetical protein